MDRAAEADQIECLSAVLCALCTVSDFFGNGSVLTRVCCFCAG